jgi:hypothetical protein
MQTHAMEKLLAHSQQRSTATPTAQQQNSTDQISLGAQVTAELAGPHLLRKAAHVRCITRVCTLQSQHIFGCKAARPQPVTDWQQEDQQGYQVQ